VSSSASVQFLADTGAISDAVQGLHGSIPGIAGDGLRPMIQMDIRDARGSGRCVSSVTYCPRRREILREERSCGKIARMGVFLIGTAIVVLLGFPLRKFGRWVQRKGREFERKR
jgi:hypothetical protein